VLLFLSIFVLSFYVQRNSHYANFRTNHVDPKKAIQILGEYRTFRAGLGLPEVPSNLRSPSSHSFRAHSSSFHADNIVPSPLARRIETASLTSGLDDAPEHQLDVRKMLRRTSTFGLGLSIHSHGLSGDSHSLPAHSHPNLSEDGSRPPPLHFAVDSIREPCISSEDVLREYARLNAKDSNLDGVDATSIAKGGTSNPKPKTSQKGKSSSTSRASARVSPGRRSRGRRRPSRVEH
jgi:hypothetical protein